MTMDEAIKDLKNIHENITQFSKHVQDIPISKISFIMEKYDEITRDNEYQKFLEFKKTVIDLYKQIENTRKIIDELKRNKNPK